MNKTSINLLLADDDLDDCQFFQEALEELPVDYSLSTVNNGVQLMQHLTRQEALPDLLFLDLNMPRKNGIDCLSEIKQHEKLKRLPVIIYSTSLNHEIVDMLYKKGALHYIRKPGEFSSLKKVILKAITITSQNDQPKSTKENFVIQV